MEEIWKPVPDFEGHYEVSNLGRVRSVDKMVWNGHGYYLKNGRILRPAKNTSRSTPYFYVGLNRGHSLRSLSLSVIVCKAFHGPKPKEINGDTDVECMHLNGNSLDNRADNLAWGTHTENMNEEKCRINHKKSSAKKEVIQYDLLGNEVARFESVREAARVTGLSDDHIAKCAAGVKYYHTHGGFKWKYNEKAKSTD